MLCSHRILLYEMYVHVNSSFHSHLREIYSVSLNWQLLVVERMFLWNVAALLVDSFIRWGTFWNKAIFFEVLLQVVPRRGGTAHVVRAHCTAFSRKIILSHAHAPSRFPIPDSRYRLGQMGICRDIHRLRENKTWLLWCARALRAKKNRKFANVGFLFGRAEG
jgi:hypothetical protein